MFDDTILIYDSDCENDYTMECMQYNLDDLEDFNIGCGFIFRGSLHLWNGVKYRSYIEENIRDFIYGGFRGIDSVSIEYNNDEQETYINLYHHDGTNTFGVRVISEQAMVSYNTWSEDLDDNRTLQELYNEMWKDSLPIKWYI